MRSYISGITVSPTTIIQGLTSISSNNQIANNLELENLAMSSCLRKKFNINLNNVNVFIGFLNKII
jgi:hypothetical protein